MKGDSHYTIRIYTIANAFSCHFLCSTHICKFQVDLLVEENSPLPSQLRLEALLGQSYKLLLGYTIQVGFSQAVLNNLNDSGIARPIHHALEIDGATWSRLSVA